MYLVLLGLRALGQGAREGHLPTPTRQLTPPASEGTGLPSRGIERAAELSAAFCWQRTRCGGVGVTIYCASGASVSWHLVPSLLLGATLSVPLAAYIVSRIPTGRLTLLTGGLSTTLGGYTLIRLLL